jgi:hypothetical protein
LARGRRHETTLVVTIKRCVTKSIISFANAFSSDVTFALEESRWMFTNRIFENGWDFSLILWRTTWLTCI